AARQRFNFQHHVTELPVTAGLLLVAPARGDLLADSFEVGNACWVDVDDDLIAVLERLTSVAQVHFALTAEQGFAGLAPLQEREGRVFFDQLDRKSTRLNSS